MYEVDDKFGCTVYVSDKDIESAIISDEPLKHEIVEAMGKSHNEKYLPYLYAILYHENFFMRVDAAQSIMNINEQLGLSELKKYEAQLDESQIYESPCEKARIMAMIIRIEEGVEGVKAYFSSNDGYDDVKSLLLNYTLSSYKFNEEDVDLICFALNAFADKEFAWIKRLSKTDYNEFVYFAFCGLYVIGTQTDVLSNISDELSNDICLTIEKLMKQNRVNTDTKELIAEVSKHMRRNYAIQILKLLKDNVKGDARKVYKQSLKQWQINEEDL